VMELHRKMVSDRQIPPWEAEWITESLFEGLADIGTQKQ
jgi:hypothetical protein